MPNTTTSPNMLLPVPVVGVDPGPDWATDIDACLNQIDSHNHSTGQGVPITPDGIDINQDLSMGGFDLTDTDAVVFQARVAALTSLLRSLQVVSADLYFIDGAGNSVRITQGGSVTGSSGTITGLPSGTASASFSGGTFTWQAATNTPATMDMGPAIIRSTTASSKGVTVSSRSTMAADYNLFVPLVAPAANQLPISDGSGNLSWTFGLLPIGSVIATFPNLSGAYSSSGTTAADTYGFVRCIGQTMADATSPMNGAVIPNINNSIFLLGSTTAGSSGGSATASGVGAHTHTFSSSSNFPTGAHTHTFYHTHIWAHQDPFGNFLSSRTSSTPASTSISLSDNNLMNAASQVSGGSGITPATPNSNTTANHYTTGVLDPPTGSSGITAATETTGAVSAVSGTTGSTGTSFSILPPYISAVYLMRVK